MDYAIARSYEKQKEKQGLPTFDVWTELLKMQYKELNRVYGGCTDKELLSDDDLECNNNQQDEENNDVTKLNSDVEGGQHDEQGNYMDSNLDELISKVGLGVTWAVIEGINSNVDTTNKKGIDEEADKTKENTNVATQLKEGVSNVGLGEMGAAENEIEVELHSDKAHMEGSGTKGEENC
ncbi:uncharacterized protein LOC141652306 [Silene latifolia]|uniref:uncharacterized protein LOC141652306 n=1 Tax=Silene latifolia TaxID=37657 RepID=UPI003D77B923